MIYLIKAIIEELQDPITLLGFSGVAVLGFADRLSRSLLFFEAHQWAIVGFCLFVLAFVKKIYEIKAAMVNYKQAKDEESEG